MENSSGSRGDRSVSIGGDATGSSIVTGDDNVVTTKYEQVTLPAAESVDISAELTALREVLEKLDSPDGAMIGRSSRFLPPSAAPANPLCAYRLVTM